MKQCRCPFPRLASPDADAGSPCCSCGLPLQGPQLLNAVFEHERQLARSAERFRPKLGLSLSGLGTVLAWLAMAVGWAWILWSSIERVCR